MSAAKRQRELNRAKKEHESAKLSAQIATGNVVLANIAESVTAKQIERQAAQINHLQMALADTEALEEETSARCLKQAAQIEMMRFALTGAIAMVGHQDNIDYLKSVLSTTPDEALEQFAAIADLSGVIMCEKKPVAYMAVYKDQVMGFIPTQESGTIPVYRAIKELP